MIDKSRTVLEQFKEGLQTLEIAGLLRQHPNLFRPYFCFAFATVLTASCIDDMFKISVSEDDTRLREKEDLVIMHWRDYLQDCEGTMLILYYSVHVFCCTQEKRIISRTINFQNILD